MSDKVDIVERLRGAPHYLLNLGARAEALMLEAADVIEAMRSAPEQCEGCDAYFADPPSKLCTGCQAYRDHQA